MRRHDLQGRRAPRWLTALITSRYGSTPFGEPRYRLVWAPSRFERSGGEWVDWDGGRVVRREQRVRWVRKYPQVEAWLIERWHPAADYGTPKQWYRPLAEGGTQLSCGVLALGDYPQFGDYEDIGARMAWYPSERHVTLAIDAMERQMQQASGTPLARAQRRVQQAEAAQERRDAAFDALAADVFDDATPAFHGAPLIGYGGSHRPALVEMAEEMGIRQHPL